MVENVGQMLPCDPEPHSCFFLVPAFAAEGVAGGLNVSRTVFGCGFLHDVFLCVARYESQKTTNESRMQPKNDTHVNFFDRTNELARFLRIDVGEVADLLGVSRATLFRYRSGKTSIPEKALKKLRAAERNAGIADPLTLSLAGAQNDAEREAILRGATLLDRLDAYPLGSNSWIMTLHEAIYSADTLLSSFAENSRDLSQLSLRAGELISEQGKPAEELLALGRKVGWQSRKVFELLDEFLSAVHYVAERVKREVVDEKLIK